MVIIRNPKCILDLILIMFYFITTKIIVQYVPLKYYHWRFSNVKGPSLKEMQPYYNDFRLIHIVKQLMPWKVTCLMKSNQISCFIWDIANAKTQISIEKWVYFSSLKPPEGYPLALI